MSERITSVEQIESLYGFKIVEFTPGYTVLGLPSEYTVKVTRTPPFMFDAIKKDDLKDPGPFKIKIRLLAQLRPDERIEQEILWEPPKDEEGDIVIPEWDEEDKGWAYYKQWEMHEHLRAEMLAERNRRQWEFILLNCIEVLDGPCDVKEDGWLEPLLTVVDEPQTYGERKLLFLRSKVILPQQAMHVIGFFTSVQEVTMEGLLQAFDSFRRVLRWNTSLAALGPVAGQ